MEQVTQDDATLNLMMHREVDKRIVLALMQMLDPTEDPKFRDLNMKRAEQTMDEGDPARIRQMMSGLIVNVLLKDGSLMHNIRSKLAEQTRSKGY